MGVRQDEKAPTPKERAAAATRAKRQRQEADELDPPNDDDDEPPSKLPEHRVRTHPDGIPKPKAQRNFTDPDSRFMVDGQGAYVQGYNAQVFGQIKEARGFRRFLVRGLHKVRAEWAQLSATHNRLLLFRRAWTLA